MRHGDVTDSVHGSAEGRAVGAMEERAKCCGHLSALERKNKTGVERIVVLHGGIGPAPRQRALAALGFEEREEISRIAAARFASPKAVPPWPAKRTWFGDSPMSPNGTSRVGDRRYDSNEICQRLSTAHSARLTLAQHIVAVSDAHGNSTRTNRRL